MRQQQLRVATAPTWPRRGTELGQYWPRKDNKNEIINLTERNGWGQGDGQLEGRVTAAF